MKSKSRKTSKIIFEIKTYAKDIIDKKHDQDLKEVFKIFDEDNSGEIDAEELWEILMNVSDSISQE